VSLPPNAVRVEATAAIASEGVTTSFQAALMVQTHLVVEMRAAMSVCCEAVREQLDKHFAEEPGQVPADGGPNPHP